MCKQKCLSILTLPLSLSPSQDLIKYTPPHHPDRVTLQLALARCETIAEHLNEAKRTKEQQTIVTHLSSRVTDLPFKLHDSPNRCLLLQELVTRLVSHHQTHT